MGAERFRPPDGYYELVKPVLTTDAGSSLCSSSQFEH